MAKTPLLLAYDAECSLCVKRADWIAARDAAGLLTLFPLQHPELAKIAPELAGRTLHGELHGLDLSTRVLLQGPPLLPEILSRLPRWRLVAPLLRLPGMARFAAWFMLKRDERRFQRHYR
jgi:predicted DCC family thiol-disulfide oxidoreductase YuxK